MNQNYSVQCKKCNNLMAPNLKNCLTCGAKQGGIPAWAIVLIVIFVGFPILIILLGIIAAIATPLINSLVSSSAKRSCCTDAGGVWEGNTCVAAPGSYAYSEDDYYKCIAELD